MKKSLIILLIMLIFLAYPLTSCSNTSKYSSSSIVSAANKNLYSITTNTSLQSTTNCYNYDISSFITEINMRVYNMLHSGIDRRKPKVDVSKDKTRLNKERSALFQVREFFFLKEE